MTLKHYSIIDIGESLFNFDNDFVSRYEDQNCGNFLATAKKALFLKYKTTDFCSLTKQVPETEIHNTIEQFILQELTQTEQNSIIQTSISR